MKLLSCKRIKAPHYTSYEWLLKIVWQDGNRLRVKIEKFDKLEDLERREKELCSM